MQRLFRLRLILPLLLLAGLGAAAWWWRFHSRSTVSFTTATIKRGDVVASIGATGTIKPLETVDVGAQVAGPISAFGKDKDGNTVDYGAVVEQGALLAKIDDSVYAADLSVAKAGQLSAAANLEQMKAKLDQAVADWNRAQELFKSKLISQVDFDTAKANYEVAKANVSVANSGVAQARADLEKAQRNLDFCTINSPVSAVVLCLAGGAVGILLGRGASVAITTFLHWPTVLSLPAIIASVAVSCTVGILFGFYPAWKASRLDPIEALRYE
jgi:HlyD family secretion protein